MALINCPECIREVSDRALTCPNCGYHINPPVVPRGYIGVQSSSLGQSPRLPAKKSNYKGCLILIGIGFVFAVILGLIERGQPGSSSGDNTSEMLLAYDCAENCIKQKLKSPGSAKFPGLLEKVDHVSSMGGSKYKIISWVDSQNGFGALIRTKFVCIVMISGDRGSCEDSALF